MVIGLFIGLRMVSFRGFRDLDEARFALLAIVVAIPIVAVGVAVSFLVPIAIHEFGHYLAGRSVGFRFVTGVVGPLGLRQEGERIVPFRARPTLLGGYVSMTPPDEHDATSRYARFILGGPVASLLWVALILTLWRISGVPFSFQIGHGSGKTGLIQLGFLYTTFFALLLLPGTLLPLRIRSLGGLPTDMMRLLILRRGGEESESLFAILEMQRLLLEGIPPDRLPERLLTAAERHAGEDAQKLSALQMRWAAELERDPRRAEELAQRIGTLSAKLGESMPKVWTDSTALIQAEQAAFVRKDADAAEAHLRDVEASAPPHRLSKATLEAALAAIRRSPDLPQRINRAEEILSDVSRRTRQSLAFERRWLARMREGWPSDPANPLEDQ